MNAGWVREAVAFAVALGCVLASVPLIRRVCVRWGIFDPPGHLKIHGEPIPRLGGMAIAVALAAGVTSALHGAGAGALYFAAALGLVWLAGFVDDLREVPPVFRLLAQIGGALLLYAGGWRVAVFSSSASAIIVQCLLVILFVNAFNFLDGADGLAAGITAVIALAYSALPGVGLSAFGNAVAWSLLGACVGFLFFNFPPAKIFMGDSGSTVLGFCVAFLGLDFIGARGGGDAARSVLFPFLIAGLPILDALVVVARRMMKGRSPFRGDRGHFYDYLLAAGWTAWRVAISCYLLTGVLGVLGWFAMPGGSRRSLILGVGIFAGLVVSALRLGALRLGAIRQARDRVRI
jgi:UDP-GlcNAc:undecaprenyl-phosphate/decaprenyl-phosphate GlcNAc-1-phosphate transferase